LRARWARRRSGGPDQRYGNLKKERDTFIAQAKHFSVASFPSLDLKPNVSFAKSEQFVSALSIRYQRGLVADAKRV
jgi:hypothetical protein